jgi:5'-nucleotidase
VAFTNPGGIRADIVGVPPGGPGARRGVTYGELFAAQPFANVLTVVTMTGDAIRRLLEQQFDNPRPGATKFLQVSRGFTYRYALGAPAGRHVDASTLALNGRVFEPTASLRVATNNFLIEGGDGFTVFREGTDPAAADIDVDALVEYFRRLSPIGPGRLDRIVRTD